MANLFVTGITGKIGMRLLPLLKEVQEDKVAGATTSATMSAFEAEQPWIENLKYNKKIFLVRPDEMPIIGKIKKEGKAGYEFDVIEGEIFDFSSGKYADEETIIVHIAGIFNMSQSPDILDRVNHEGTKNVLRQFNKIKHFIFISSTTVYGFHNGTINEKSSYLASHAYAKSKALAEKEVMESKAPYTILQPSMIYGKEYNQPYFKVLGKMEKGSMIRIGKGDNVFSLVHVQDVADGIMHFIRKGPANGKYLLTSGENLTQNEMYRIISDKTGWKVPKYSVPVWFAKLMAPLVGFNPYDVERMGRERRFSIEKIRSAGFSPKVKFREGVDELIELYKISRKQE